ncbi:Alpha/Beta hydrolase protein [Fennellomyces sp. T-0311]|nr:Alpha/Beta hydrolase protein [Fennellomyces sp. T-0311]
MTPIELHLNVSVEDRNVVHDGKNLRLTLFRPLGTESDVLPIVIFYHGGGWIFGSKYTHGKPVREICVKSHVTVAFAEYSLGPENKFPIAHEECFATLVWVLANGDSINGNTDKIAVCGDSAGGNLAACISSMAKKHGLDNAIKSQIMIYPALTVASRRRTFESVKLFGTGDFGLKFEDSQFYDGSYFDNYEKCKSSLPLHFAQEEIKGLPPALLITAEVDILRDEGETYARMLTEAGVPTLGIRIMGASKC